MVTEAGSYLRLIDSCITQLKAHGPSRTCKESKEEEEGVGSNLVLDREADVREVEDHAANKRFVLGVARYIDTEPIFEPSYTSILGDI